MAPRIERRNLHDIKVKEGEPVFYDVKIQGEPAPTVVWNQNNKTILTNSNVQITNVPYNSKFKINKADRKLCGTYKITATNQYGMDSVEVEVEVVGEFQVENVYFSCNSWQFIRLYSNQYLKHFVL